MAGTTVTAMATVRTKVVTIKKVLWKPAPQAVKRTNSIGAGGAAAEPPTRDARKTNPTEGVGAM